MTQDDETLLEAILARPHLVARIVALHAPPAAPRVKPRGSKVPVLGDNAKQRKAFLRLSPERQAFVVAAEEWRKAWKQWRYFGVAHPGPDPVDTTSPEALAMAERNRQWKEYVTEHEAILVARWGGDAAYAVRARDDANRNAPGRFSYSSDEAHAEAVRAFMDEASAKSRALAAMAKV